MLNLNLISKEDKQTFKFFVWRRILLYLGGMTGVMMLVFIVLMIPSFLFLNFQRKEILRELAVEKEAIKTFAVEPGERRILLLNKKTERIRALDSNELSVSEFLDRFASLTAGIKINGMKVDFAANSIGIDGVAPTRNGLLLFQHSLEESNLVARVSAPVSDLVKFADVEFTLKGALR